MMNALSILGPLVIFIGFILYVVSWCTACQILANAITKALLLKTGSLLLVIGCVLSAINDFAAERTIMACLFVGCAIFNYLAHILYSRNLKALYDQIKKEE